jgi:hypothetical protein
VPPLQSLPQLPQLLGSVCKSVQPVPQHRKPGAQLTPSQVEIEPPSLAGTEASAPPELLPPTGENVAVTEHVTSPHVAQKFVSLPDPLSSLVPPLLDVPLDVPPLEPDPEPASSAVSLPASDDSGAPVWPLGHCVTPLKFSTALSV